MSETFIFMPLAIEKPILEKKLHKKTKLTLKLIFKILISAMTYKVIGRKMGGEH